MADEEHKQPTPRPDEFSADPDREAYVNDAIKREVDFSNIHASLALDPLPGARISPEDHAKIAVEAATSLADIEASSGKRYDAHKEEEEDVSLAVSWLSVVSEEVNSDEQRSTLDKLRNASAGPNPQLNRMLADLERAATAMEEDHRITSATHSSRRIEQLVGLQILLSSYNQ